MIKITTQNIKSYDKNWGTDLTKPWYTEPDKVQYLDPTTNLPCLIVRNQMGALCGYVGVSPTHKAYGVHYDHEMLRDVYIHGGLTFASRCSHIVCHTVEDGESDDVWWLGFDCSHVNDYTPSMAALGLSYDSTDIYRTVEYVKDQNIHLASKLVTIV